MPVFRTMFMDMLKQFLMTGPLLEQDAADRCRNEQGGAGDSINRCITISTLEIEVCQPDYQPLLASLDNEGQMSLLEERVPGIPRSVAK